MTETFDWSIPGLDRPLFTALANLLTLRNGGQVEPASLPDDSLECNDSGDESDTSSNDTSRSHLISKSQHNRVKRKFLDHLAELAANKKGGHHVACSAMREKEDSVRLWIARNDGFQEVDRVFFQKLGEILCSFRPNQGTGVQTSETALWLHMLGYYKHRLENTFIPDLQSSLRDCDHLLTSSYKAPFSEAIQQLSILQRSVFDDQPTEGTLLDRHDHLVRQSYELRKTKAVKDLLIKSPIATARTRNCGIIIDTLPSFAKVDIVLVPLIPFSQDPIKDSLTLKKTLENLDLQLDLPTIKVILGETWTVVKAEQQFRQLQRQKLNVHAEVQMVTFFSKLDGTFDQIFRYFGCSKYSCFMCSHFLKAHGTFKTRGSHGRLFKPCTIPTTTGLVALQKMRLYSAVLRVQKDIQKELENNFERVTKQEKTSVADESTVFSENSTGQAGNNAVIEKRRMNAEQERVRSLFKRLELSQKHDTTHRSAIENEQFDGEEEYYMSECYVCPRLTSRRCSVCGQDRYCSKSCEDKRSGSHIFNCAKRSLTTADFLFKSIIEDELPVEKDVLEDYGFNYFTSFADKSNLLGLYQGFKNSDDITAEDVHRWRVEGSLVAHIKKYFYSIPEGSRGGYFPWFLKNTICLDKPQTKGIAAEQLVLSFFDKAKTYLDVEDQIKTFHQLEPEAKRLSYRMLACNTHAAYPNPVDENWYNFGFCTCTDERSERSLGGLYQRLLLGNKSFGNVNSQWFVQILSRLATQSTATFSEFWHAFETGSLISLMDLKGLQRDRQQFLHLEAFLSVPPTGSRPSVWALKQYVTIDNPAENHLPRVVSTDYGFINCRTFEDVCILMEIYKRLFTEADPLELHAMCLEGKLFEFAQRYHKMEEKHRRLLNNFYPL